MCIFYSKDRKTKRKKCDIIRREIKKAKGDTMSSKKYAKNSKSQQKEFRSVHSPVKVWVVRVVVVLLCIAVAITLIPSVFF